MTGDAYERLVGRFVGSTWYRVPAVRRLEFTTLQTRAGEIHGRHALSWTLRHDTREVGTYQELGPRFREQADLRTAAREFDEQPGLLDGLAELQLDYPPGATRFPGGWSYLSVEPVGRFETVLHVGLDHLTALAGYDLPPVDPARMTMAMRRAQRLARLAATRLDLVVPESFSMRAVGEVVVLYQNEKPVARENLVDVDPEVAGHQLIEGLQDYLSEELTVPWPHDPARGYAFHEPRTEIRDGALRWWYGEEDNPVLAIDPIPLANLADD